MYKRFLKLSSAAAALSMCLSANVNTAYAETSASVMEAISEKQEEVDTVDKDIKNIEKRISSAENVAEQYKNLLSELKTDTNKSSLKCISISTIYNSLLSYAVSDKSNNAAMSKAVRDMIDSQGNSIAELKENKQELLDEKSKIENDISELNERYEELREEEEEAEKRKAEEEAASRVSSTTVTGGHNTYSYSDSELDLIYAIVGQECSSNYEGVLAVISCACNRAVSSQWSSYGSDPLSQLMAPSQFCYSIDNYWRRRLNGNVSQFVKDAVNAALSDGIRNHNYLSFRGYYTEGSVCIGDNYYFNSMN